MIFFILVTFLIVSAVNPVFASSEGRNEFLVEKDEMIPLPIDPLSDEEIKLQIDAISNDFNKNILPKLDKKTSSCYRL